jgi:hypothetical protein
MLYYRIKIFNKKIINLINDFLIRKNFFKLIYKIMLSVLIINLKGKHYLKNNFKVILLKSKVKQF